MLKSLHIENIAVIERTDVEFQGGLSVLTGETGAGKSIIIDAIHAVLGSRASRELVRTGAEQASVTAVFESDAARRWCAENDIDAEETEIVLHRRLSPDGKSSARVNGVPVAAAQLRELGALLLDIHGQNDGRMLLDERTHREHLDRYGVPDKILADYTEAYTAYCALLKEAEHLREDQRDKLMLEESLRSRIRELEQAELRPGEESELTQRRDLLRNSEKLTELLDAAYAALYDGEESAVSLSAQAENAAEKAAAWSPDLMDCASAIRESRLVLEDAAERVRDKRRALDFSPEEYDRLEERLALLRRLEKKYAVDEAGLAALLTESRERLDALEYAEDRLLRLEKDAAAALTRLTDVGRALSRERRRAADLLEKQVERELRELSMPSVRFQVLTESRESPDASGMDDIRFIMSANAGEAPGPISRIASGGELARIMLALKSVFSERDPVDALIFDEIDTGVSGVAAQKVAEKLALLGRDKQVLCVTHLPQIAAMAQQQYLVEKEERDGRTYTGIRLLDRDARRREIARLSGGELMSESMLAGAEELLANGDAFRTAH